MKSKYFILYQDCQIIKGAKNILLCDLYTKNSININEVYSYFEDDLSILYEDKSKEIIDFLTEEKFGYISVEKSTHRKSLQWESSKLINEVIIEHSKNEGFSIENVYKKPLPNRYLAGFARFLAENRGHYMIENIIEDGLNDFFFQHLCKYPEIWKYPVHFTGGISHGFKDVIKQLCSSYEFELGHIYKTPMEGLVRFHS